MQAGVQIRMSRCERGRGGENINESKDENLRSKIRDQFKDEKCMQVNKYRTSMKQVDISCIRDGRDANTGSKGKRMHWG